MERKKEKCILLVVRSETINNNNNNNNNNSKIIISPSVGSEVYFSFNDLSLHYLEEEKEIDLDFWSRIREIPQETSDGELIIMDGNKRNERKES